MTRMQKGYEIPDPIDPGDALCIRTYVPNDRKYIAAFWGAYQYMTTWLAWEKDGTDRAKQAAAVWRPWYELARSEWEAGLGCGDWYQPSPYPGEAPLQIIIKTASDWLYYFRDVLVWPAIVILNAGGSAEDAAEYLIDKMAVFGPADVTDAAWEMAFAMFGKTEIQRVDAFDNANWKGLYQKAACEMVTYEGALGDDAHWLDTLADIIISWLDASADWIFQMLEGTAALLTGSTAMRAAWAAEGGGASYGYDDPLCEWTQTLDFRISSYGWGGSPLGRAQWAAGLGFKRGPDSVSVVQIQSPGFAMTRFIEVTYYVTIIPDRNYQCRAPDVSGTQFSESIVLPGTASPNFTIDAFISGLWITAENNIGDGYLGYIEKIEMHGYGSNPFIT